jgi:choline-sulfatase
LIDRQVGEILQTIERRGEMDNTVIAFSSDHGEMNGDHGLIYKSNFFDGAVRVPMLLRTPDTVGTLLAGSVNRRPVEWFDLGPTLVELAGGSLDHQQFARSLVPFFSRPEAKHRQEAISEFRGEVMILDQRWKMAINRDGLPYLLFDQVDDPQETRNLVGLPEVAAIEDALRQRVLERLVQAQVHKPRLD